MTHTKAAQQAFVTGGLALGLIARDMTTIERDKVRFDLAFEGAWLRWAHSATFPAIARRTGPDVYYQVVDDYTNARQHIPVAAFYDSDHGHSVEIRRDDDSLEDCIDELERHSGVPWAAWQQLADEFLSLYA